ncbi:LapA family protein [Alkalibacillus almallahensis]|uniref:LapA family protein n=1 Tax=Alkalibacillus almallahensis TaxID=1379154 RepID=UPI00141F80E5|nr:lipopolysaccharide assembly protein LapA domain-containing protein [Alkalibacillus almallahensis]NIK11269.1 putative integral membrane protein [Alkalibacillus almallahensis]
MKQQTMIILSIIFTLIIAIFAVINVESVPVDFLFTQTEAPLILVILISVLLGALVVAGGSFAKIYQLQRQLKQAKTHSEHESSQTQHESTDFESDQTTENIDTNTENNK